MDKTKKTLLISSLAISSTPSFKKKGALLSRLIDITINQVPRNNYSKNNKAIVFRK